MITLYRNADCPFSEEIEEIFREIVIAYEIGNKQELSKALLQKLPFIIDGKKHIYDQDEIQKYLRELKNEMVEWQKFQSDSCYPDDEGKVCYN